MSIFSSPFPSPLQLSHGPQQGLWCHHRLPLPRVHLLGCPTSHTGFWAGAISPTAIALASTDRCDQPPQTLSTPKPRPFSSWKRLSSPPFTLSALGEMSTEKCFSASSSLLTVWTHRRQHGQYFHLSTHSCSSPIFQWLRWQLSLQGWKSHNSLLSRYSSFFSMRHWWSSHSVSSEPEMDKQPLLLALCITCLLTRDSELISNIFEQFLGVAPIPSRSSSLARFPSMLKSLAPTG